MVPFEKSPIWQELEEKYVAFGSEAWSRLGVPFYLTCCPLLVERCFRAFCAFIDDCLKKGSIDQKEPLYLFDLGAGTCRFAYQFLQLLEEKAFPFNVCYIATDISEKTFSFWQSHPYLQSYIESGVLDFASYKVGQKETLRTFVQKKVLESLKNPVLLFAHYFFDTIPQALYRTVNGEVEKGFVERKASLDTLRYTFISDRAAPPLVRSYAQERGKGSFLYPLGAIETLEYFLSCCKKPLLCLHSDQAVSTLEQDAETEHPKIARHGTFSLEVNYALLRRWAVSQGGESFFESRLNPAFAFAATVLGGNGIAFSSLEREVACWNERTLYEYFEETEALTGSLGILKKKLKEGRYDPLLPFVFYSSFYQALETANPEEKELFTQDLTLCLKRFFPISQEEGQVYSSYAALASLCGAFSLAKKWEKEGKSLFFL